MSIEAEHIVALYRTRRSKRQPMMDKRLEVLNQYNGDTHVVLPELDSQEKPAVANLLNLGLDGFAQRGASTLPDIQYPSLRPGFDKWDECARASRKANLGWWDMNRMQMLEYKRWRFLLAFSSAPVSIHPTGGNMADKREIPHWRLRSPLNTFAAEVVDELDCEPTDYICSHNYSLAWLEEHYPAQAAVLYKGRESAVSRDMTFEVLEYNDCDETVLVAVGATRSENREPMAWEEQDAGSAPMVVLSRMPNRAGVCNLVVPGRIVLDKPIGQFDAMLHLFRGQAKMAAYEQISIDRSIFPTVYVQSHPNAPTRPRIIRDADARQGIIGLIENGIVQPISLNPGAQVPTAIDRLERAARVAAGIPPQLGAENPTNVRTGRASDGLMGSAMDMPLQENQEIMASAKEAENYRAVATMKGYYGKKQSMYVIPRDGKVSTIPGHPDVYVPNDTFVTDTSSCKYAFLGSDASSIPIEIGQRLGTGEISMQTAREKDPFVSDPELERDRTEEEGLLKGLLGGMENMAAQGQLDPMVIARVIKEKRNRPGANLADVYLDVHKVMQAEQAQQQAAQPQPPPGPPGAPPGPPGPPPAQMPGAAVPPGGVPSVPAPQPGQLNLQDLVGALKAGASGPG